MSRRGYKRLSYIILSLVGLCAFELIPAHYPDNARSHLANIFAPVSMPVRLLATWTHDKVSPAHAIDPGSPDLPRNDDEIRRENADLRVMVANLQSQLEKVNQWQDELGYLGPIRSACTRWRIAGSDSGGRESVTIAGGSFSGLAKNMPVLYADGLVGRIDRVGPAGAQIRLITDPAMRFTVSFARWSVDQNRKARLVRIAIAPTLIEGAGNGALLIRGLRSDQVKELQIDGNTIVLLDDDAWPIALSGYHVGKVARVDRRPDAPGFAQILVRPGTDLTQLHDVMVMSKP